MTPDEVTRAIQTYMVANWTDTPAAYDNVSFEPPEGMPWIRVHVILGKGFQDEMTEDGLGHRDGVLKVQVFTPLGSGSQDGGALAGKIEKLFKRKEIGGLYFTRDGLDPWTEEPGDDGKGWYMHVVNAPFWCWT